MLLDFLTDYLTLEELQEDFEAIFDILYEVVDLGALEFYFTEDLEEIKRVEFIKRR